MPRPRGFIDWRPQRRTHLLLDAVLEELTEYAEQLPLTIRQIFYRLVGRDLIDKTEAGYGRLVELCNRARRARVIDMEAIRDDGVSGSLSTGAGWESPGDWIATLIDDTQYYARDRQEGQETRLLIWCEAGGMVPQLERVASPYGVSVASSGGFDSLTVKHRAGRDLGAEEPVEVLHIGDWDPSGECMFDALAEDIAAFAGDYGNTVAFHRLAVTPEQVARYSLPTAPPKASTHQARKRMTETVQAEALDPATLARIVEDAIRGRFDLDVYQHAVEREARERDELRTRVQQLIGGAL
jgi:hypothetical protein